MNRVLKCLNGVVSQEITDTTAMGNVLTPFSLIIREVEIVLVNMMLRQLVSYGTRMMKWNSVSLNDWI